MRAVFLRLVFGLALFPASGMACEFCLLSQGISPLQTLNGAGLRINHRYSLLDEVYAGSREVPNAGAAERFWTTEVTGFYGMTDNFLLMATLPIRQTEGIGEVGSGPDGDAEFEDARGGASDVGDLSLLGRCTFFKHHTLASTTLLALTAGVKLPSGSTDSRGDSGDYLDAHLQTGTGSTDFLVGLSASHALGRFNVSANLLAAIPGEGEFGTTSHEFGESMNYDLTAKYRVLPQTPGASPVQCFVSLGLNGEWRAQEAEEGASVGDSGGHVLYLTPGVQVVLGAHWIVEASFQQAVQHELDGVQLGETYKISGGVTYLF